MPIPESRRGINYLEQKDRHPNLDALVKLALSESHVSFSEICAVISSFPVNCTFGPRIEVGTYRNLGDEPYLQAWIAFAGWIHNPQHGDVFIYAEGATQKLCENLDFRPALEKCLEKVDWRCLKESWGQ